MFRKLYIFTYIIIGLTTSLNAIERSIEEIKIGIFLEDIKEFGEFYKINNSPKGMFPETSNNIKIKKIKKKKKFIDTFVKQKGLMEKYTDRVIIGMGYFEFFYKKQ